MPVSCADYGMERRLEALRRELARQDLTQERRAEVLAEVEDLERRLGMD